jgi:purine-binding chemotaxis protein CheW
MSFDVGAALYGVDLLRVREARSWKKPTRRRLAPSGSAEAIGFRGGVVPLVDMRHLFGLEPFGASAHRDVIIVQAQLADGERTAGLVVDAVRGEVDVRGMERRDGPDIAGQSHLNVVDGIVNIDDASLLTLLDLPRLLSCGLGLTATMNVECPGCDAAPGVDCSSCLSSQSSPF